MRLLTLKTVSQFFVAQNRKRKESKCHEGKGENDIRGISCLQVLAESNYPPSLLKMVPSSRDSNLEERNDRQIKVILGEREFVENEQRQTDCCL